MPEKSTLRIDGIGLTSPNRDVVAGTIKTNGTDVSTYGAELFIRTVTITSTGAGTAVTILSDAEVGTGRKVYVTDVYGCVAGATGWSGGSFTSMAVQDTNSSPVAFFTIPVADVNAANEKVFRQSTTVSVENAWVRMTGGTSGKGLVLVGNANAAAGSDVILTVIGHIA